MIADRMGSGELTVESIVAKGLEDMIRVTTARVRMTLSQQAASCVVCAVNVDLTNRVVHQDLR